MERMKVQFIGLCASCRVVTVLHEDCADPDDPHSMDLMEDRIPKAIPAACGKCDKPCCGVSMSINGQRVEPWMSPEDYEARYGEGKPLPPKPWNLGENN